MIRGLFWRVVTMADQCLLSMRPVTSHRGSSTATASLPASSELGPFYPDTVGVGSGAGGVSAVAGDPLSVVALLGGSGFGRVVEALGEDVGDVVDRGGVAVCGPNERPGAPDEDVADGPGYFVIDRVGDFGVGEVGAGHRNVFAGGGDVVGVAAVAAQPSVRQCVGDVGECAFGAEPIRWGTPGNRYLVGRAGRHAMYAVVALQLLDDVLDDLLSHDSGGGEFAAGDGDEPVVVRGDRVFAWRVGVRGAGWGSDDRAESGPGADDVVGAYLGVGQGVVRRFKE